MNAIIYYISLPFIHLLGLLPEWPMYRMSDLLYLLVYRLIGYRKQVVRMNLKNSFPEKSADERLVIEKQFYKHFCDLILETFSTIHMSAARTRRHVDFSQHTILQSFKEKNQSLIYVTGHTGNWELVGTRYCMEDLNPIYVLYSPLANPYFNRLVYRIRIRGGTRLIAMNDTYRMMVKNKNKLTATTFIADQTPSPEHAHWLPFLNQETPFFVGTAKMAKRFDYPVIYFSLNKTRRGRYEMIPEVLVEKPSLLTEEEITQRFVQRLEKDIRNLPYNWLWSHRRWKHKAPLK